MIMCLIWFFFSINQTLEGQIRDLKDQLETQESFATLFKSSQEDAQLEAASAKESLQRLEAERIHLEQQVNYYRQQMEQEQFCRVSVEDNLAVLGMHNFGKDLKIFNF